MQPNNSPTWLSPREITHEVNGSTVTFREVSVSAFMAAHELFGTIASVVLQLRRSPQLDAGLNQDSKRNGDTSFTQLPAGVDLVNHHDMQRSAAVFQLTAILDRKKLEIAKLVSESMGGVATPQQLVDAGASTFAQCMEGFFLANEQVFRPFVQVDRLIAWIKGQLPKQEDLTVAEVQSNLNRIKELVEQAKATPGDSSPSPSPSSPVEGTVQSSYSDSL